MSNATGRKDGWLLALFAGILLLLNTIRVLAVPDEGRYGEVARWMVMSGDWLTPRLNGLPFFHKPPLLYWLEASSFSLFGVSAAAARLAPTLHALLLCCAVYLYARRFFDLGAARRAALMLGCSLFLLAIAQYVNHDLLVATWISMTILAFAASIQSTGREAVGLALVGFASSALAMLSKGMIGFALPGLVLLVWLIVTRQLMAIVRIPWLRGMALFALIAAPWFILEQQKYPNFLHYFFVEQQFTRYTAHAFNNRQPVWFYVACLAILFFPWHLFMAWRCPTAEQPNQQQVLRRNWQLLWCWLLAILIFFSIPTSKLVGYIMPVVPALALLAAIGFPHTHTSRGRRWGLVAGCLLWALILTVLVLKKPIPLGQFTQVLALVSAGLWLTAMMMFSRRQAGDWEVPALALAVLCTFTTVAIAVDSDGERKSAWQVARFIEGAGQKHPIIIYGTYPFDLAFYLNRSQTYWVLDGWNNRRQFPSDTGPQQLLDGADFEPELGQKVLLEKDRLPTLAKQYPNHWLIVRSSDCDDQCDPAISENYRLVVSSPAYQIYQSRFSVPVIHEAHKL